MPRHCLLQYPLHTASSHIYLERPSHVALVHPTIPKVHHVAPKRLDEVGAVSSDVANDVAPYTPLVERQSLIARLSSVIPSILVNLEVAHHFC